MPVFVYQQVVVHLRNRPFVAFAQVRVVQEDEHPASGAVGDFPTGHHARPEEEMPVREEHQEQKQPDGVLNNPPRPLHRRAKQKSDRFHKLNHWDFFVKRHPVLISSAHADNVPLRIPEEHHPCTIVGLFQ